MLRLHYYRSRRSSTRYTISKKKGGITILDIVTHFKGNIDKEPSENDLLGKHYTLKYLNKDCYDLTVFKQGVGGSRSRGRPKKVESQVPKEEPSEITKEEYRRQAKSRAKREINELALCNEWEWFFTGTLDPRKWDRNDLDVYAKKFGSWLNQKNRKLRAQGKPSITYLIVVEKHKDGAWHIHGLLHNVPQEEIQPSPVNAKYKTWTPYSDKFGFASMDRIKNRNKLANYITKYVSKDVGNTGKGRNSYYCSKRLKRAETIEAGTLLEQLPATPWENEFVAKLRLNFEQVCETFG